MALQEEKEKLEAQSSQLGVETLGDDAKLQGPVRDTQAYKLNHEAAIHEIAMDVHSILGLWLNHLIY